MQLGRGCITKYTGDRSLHPWTRRDLFRDSETLNEMWCFWVNTSKQSKESLTVLKKNMQILCDLKEQAGELLGWLQSLFGGSFSWWVGTWSWLMSLLTPVITILMLFMISPRTINSPTHFISVYNLFLCCCKRMFAITNVFFWQNSVSLCPDSFCTPRPNLPYSRYLLTSYFCIPVHYDEKDFFFFFWC